MSSLHAKLIVIVVAALLTGAMLLVCRHRRIEVAYRMARVHERHVEQERAMWKLRSTTAERCRPGVVREMMDSLGEAWATLPSRDAAPGTAVRSTGGAAAPAVAGVHDAPVEARSPRADASRDADFRELGPTGPVSALASRGAGGG